VKLPSGVFRPYAGVSTAILFFTKTNSGGTEKVWFYDVRADGFSLDDKRTPVEANDLSDVLARWHKLDAEIDRPPTEQSFLVPKADIVAQGYDLSLNRYREIEYDEVTHRAPLDVIANIETLEDEITKGLAELKGARGAEGDVVVRSVPLGELIAKAKSARAGGSEYPLLSMTMHGGLVDQSRKFKKRVASDDLSDYKVVKRGQLVVGFPIDEAVLDFSDDVCRGNRQSGLRSVGSPG